MKNVCLITDLEPGTYEVQEQGIISANQDQYEINRKTYKIELTAQYTKENPYLIVHPNYKDRPIYADLVVNKIDNMVFSVSDVTFSCAAYIGEYTEHFLVKEIFVPDPYIITQAETSFQLSIGDTKALSIENDIKEGEAGKIVIKKVALNEGKTPLEGAVFLLYEAKQDADGNWVKEEDGTLQRKSRHPMGMKSQKQVKIL